MNAGEVFVWAVAFFAIVFVLMLIGEVLWMNLLLRREQKNTRYAMRGWKKESRRLENASFQWEFPEPPEISRNG